MIYRFEWDPDKAERNLRKHGVSFEVASRVFVDPLALTVLDCVEAGEQRLANHRACRRRFGTARCAHGA